MAERAAHLVDRVFPAVPVRQWVLSLPHRLRYRLAWDHDLCRAVVGACMRAVLGFLRHRAREAGVGDGRGGAVVIVQRFGGAVNLNVHLHALVLDGVFAKDAAGVRFHPHPSLDAADVTDVLATVEAHVQRLLKRRGLEDANAGGGTLDEWAADAPVLAGIAAASVHSRVALGSRAGARVRRRGHPPEETETPGLGRCHARHQGFDLHAGLLRTCRPAGPPRTRVPLRAAATHCARPPPAAAGGQVQLELRRRWSDGTTHLLFDPIELLERLAALTPRPHINLILYHGVLAPRAAWRSLVVRCGPTSNPGETREAGTSSNPAVAAANRPHRAGARWADLMRRSFGLEVLDCPRCGGRLRLIALIEDVSVIERLLRHLGLPTEIPEACPPRAPPLPLEGFAAR